MADVRLCGCLDDERDGLERQGRCVPQQQITGSLATTEPCQRLPGHHVFQVITVVVAGAGSQSHALEEYNLVGWSLCSAMLPSGQARGATSKETASRVCAGSGQFAKSFAVLTSCELDSSVRQRGKLSS